ncbi:TetR family transcriptional regulator [Devosia nitrariae]|uniref:TetR family transcriptional regulator n=2 Tax=Devosia nitrariae TaxID=2071872 RepID=A0ABQ5W7E6_9HYPH|nr:TetR family transcriptional regulator [Devosia nitrariae]
MTQALPSQPRKMPTQQRSRERVERILAVATDLIAERGSDAVRMSDIAEGAGVSIGSLYQYFPDKSAVIRTLAERSNEMALACVERIMGQVQDLPGLAQALQQVVDEYYGMFQDYPVTRDIWFATQADKALRNIDAEDTAAHVAQFEGVMLRIGVPAGKTEVKSYALLAMNLLAAAVRMAIVLPADEAARVLEGFKTMAARDLLARFGA